MFNEDIDKIKFEDDKYNKPPKLITFSISTQNDKSIVKYEIEGGGKTIERALVKQNEQDFFQFVDEFKKQTHSDKKIPQKRYSQNSFFVKANKKLSRFSSIKSRLSIASSVSGDEKDSNVRKNQNQKRLKINPIKERIIEKSWSKMKDNSPALT